MNSKNKLSRRAKTRPVNKQSSGASVLNNSCEDFQNSELLTEIKDKPAEEASEIKDCVVDFDENSDPLADCPMCGKTFRTGQESQRSSHIKACGMKKGLNANQLIEIRRLEERQEMERVALGLPARPPKEKKAKPKKKQKEPAKAAPPELDANFEMALALSASLAPPEELRPPIDLDVQQSSKPTAKNKGGQTVLQLRTDNERNIQISDRVAGILGGGSEDFMLKNCIFESRHSFQSPDSEFLCKIRDRETRLWKKSQTTDACKTFSNQLLDRFKVTPTLSQAPKASPTDPAKPAESTAKDPKTDLDGLSSCWLKLFRTGSKSDVTVYAKDEVPIRCHYLVLLARCPQMLKEAVEETDGSQTSWVVSCDAVDKEAVECFLEFVYSGKILRRIEEIEQVRWLAKQYKVNALSLLLEDYEEVHEVNGSFGFVTTASDDECGGAATQNMEALINLLDDSEDERTTDEEFESGGKFDENAEPPEGKTEESYEGQDLEKEQTSESHVGSPAQKGSFSPERPSSPDMFEAASDEDLFVSPDQTESKKRKSSPVQNSPKKPRTVSPPSIVYPNLDNEVCIDLTQSTPKRTSQPSSPPLLTPESPSFQSPDSPNLPTPRSSPVASPESVAPQSSPFKSIIKESSPSKSIDYPPHSSQTSALERCREYEKCLRSTTDPVILRKSLNDLLKTPVSVEILLSTEVGKAVQELRSSRDKTVAEKARTLVQKWKLLIIEHEKQHRSLSSVEKNETSLASGVENEITQQQENVWADFEEGFSRDFDDGFENSHCAVVLNAGPLKSSQEGERGLKKKIPKTKENASDTKTPENPPKSQKRRLNFTPTVTPMPDYEAMLSPALRNELRRFGLKAIPRRKAVRFLKHIYDETHPIVSLTSSQGVNTQPLAEPTKKSRDQHIDEKPHDDCANSQTASDEEVSSQASDLPEETFDGDDGVPASQVPDDLTTRLLDFIRADKDLLRQTLLYEPLWLEDLVDRFKTETKVKCNGAQVMGILDVECITFRTKARARANAKRKSPKKKSPKKK